MSFIGHVEIEITPKIAERFTDLDTGYQLVVYWIDLDECFLIPNEEHLSTRIIMLAH